MATQVYFNTGPLQDWGQTWGLGHTKGLEQMSALASGEGDEDTLFLHSALIEGSSKGTLSELSEDFSRRLVS